MHVSHQERPRELKWYHAGPMLYGDWGTSRFYVLGLAFYFALYSSFWYILGVGILVAAVGWAYTVVCRVYPDGGGVYSAARQLSPLLSVVGALMLFANYAITAALSAFEGMHYFGFESHYSVFIGAAISIVLLGFINYIGPRHAAGFALIIAIATLVLTVILGIFAIPHLSAGWEAIRQPTRSLPEGWTVLVSVVLALSGVEVVANMTGIMVKPVARTAKLTIFPVLIEVVLFNVLLGIAMLGLPSALAARGQTMPGEFRNPASTYSAADEKVSAYRHDHQNWNTAEGRHAYESFIASEQIVEMSGPNEEAIKHKVLRVMGEVYVHRWFGVACGIVFGLLLISAVNTVIGGMMSVGYSMAPRDAELPRAFSKLNIFGVPWVGLIPAVIIPIILLLIFTELETLADLYAMGVVGAIAINLSCCTVNIKLPVKLYERVAIGAIAVVMIAMELTLAIQKPHAVVFVGIIVLLGLAGRFVAKARKAVPVTAKGVPVVREEGPMVLGTPAEELDMGKPHVLVATRGGQRLLEFASDYAKQTGALLFVIYVRQWNVQFAIEGTQPTLEEDREAQVVFKAAFASCVKKGVQMVPVYAVSRDVADTILDFAATYDARALLMGVSRQGTLLRALKGDVLTAVADQLPQDIPLLIHA